LLPIRHQQPIFGEPIENMGSPTLRCFMGHCLFEGMNLYLLGYAGNDETNENGA
jgi:hypothetical protein